MNKKEAAGLRHELQTRLNALDALDRLAYRTVRNVVVIFEDGDSDTFELTATTRTLVAEVLTEEARRLEAAALGVRRTPE